ncbi:hypothetical protein [Bacillus cereus]|uniref:hypothetical protein n=1 Tax=Bacillus cereus TaxID=1396 RepID=UPI000BEB6A5E|nr:hypothetical protein [Bacillus cereus]PEE35309.1 hypothetical protein CON59_16065 [Bacillus cereus]PET50573.1 hypothetical protein CN523_05035 [Bacillus cereus]PEV86548.1 hypothetical protein CN429_03880 [Bacillus cereus]PFA56070.1 hypothetical protein CN389_14385 [Bacillus cereus]PFD66136.1 hypothetical protein CN271_22565 [Bacillus cereus]
MKKFQITYTLISPSNKHNIVGPIVIYAATEKDAEQHLIKEIQRRLGHLYQWKIDIQHITHEQTVLF